MKHVWIFNHYAIEPGGSGGTRHFNLAACLTEHGWQATLIAASVAYGRQQRLAPGENRRLELHQGVPFLWIRTPEYQGNGGGRIKNMLAFTLRSLLPSYTSGLCKPQAVVGSSVHPFAALAGCLLARRHKVPFIFEVRDLWPQTLVDMGRLKEGSLVTWALRLLEKWLYRRASRIVVLLPRASEYIKTLGIPEERVVWIPNGVDLSGFSADSERFKGEQAPFVLMYFGAHGQANGLDTVLRAMKLVAGKPLPCPIHLRLVGDGPLKPELMRLSEDLGLANVFFEEPVPKCDIPALAAQADAFLIAVLDLPQLYRYGISMNKLFDYLAAARPVIIASDAVNNPVEEAGAGMTVAPGDPEALAEAILKLSRLPAEVRQQMGRSGRNYVSENHRFELLAAKLATTLDAALEEART